MIAGLPREFFETDTKLILLEISIDKEGRFFSAGTSTRTPVRTATRHFPPSPPNLSSLPLNAVCFVDWLLPEPHLESLSCG